MTPDRPGYWWYENRYGSLQIAEVYEEAEEFRCVGGRLWALIPGYEISEKLTCEEFYRWVGPVAPPEMPAAEANE